MANEKMSPQQTGVILEEQTELTLAEISRAYAVHAECIFELVGEGVSEPAGMSVIAGASPAPKWAVSARPCAATRSGHQSRWCSTGTEVEVLRAQIRAIGEG